MPLLVESLRSIDGRFDDLEPHIERMARSRLALFGMKGDLNLPRVLDGVRSSIGPGLWKIRVLYDEEIRSVETAEYHPRPYRSAALVDGGDVDYTHKRADRRDLDRLTRRAQELGADTALFVKNGLITDFSYANAAFFDGSQWWTPRNPLLAGTRRDRLIRSGRLDRRDISPVDIHHYVHVSPINAMMDLGDVVMGMDRIIGGNG